MDTLRASLLSPLALILLIVPATMSAQGTSVPNLSGTWKINVARSKLPKATKIQSETLVIIQDGINLAFHYDTDGKQSVENYTANKKEIVMREVAEAGSKIVRKAYWKGATFITETKAVFSQSSPLGAYEMMNTKDSWTISGGGLVLTEKTQWDDGQSVSIYDKQ